MAGWGRNMWSFEYSQRLTSTTAWTEQSTMLRTRATAKKSACPFVETLVSSGRQAATVEQGSVRYVGLVVEHTDTFHDRGVM